MRRYSIIDIEILGISIIILTWIGLGSNDFSYVDCDCRKSDAANTPLESL